MKKSVSCPDKYLTIDFKSAIIKKIICFGVKQAGGRRKKIEQAERLEGKT
jgi:hypothetical protein